MALAAVGIKGLSSCPDALSASYCCACGMKVRHMYEWIRGRWCHPLSAVLTHIPPTLHRRLADAIVHVPILHGTGGCRTASELWDELEGSQELSIQRLVHHTLSYLLLSRIVYYVSAMYTIEDLPEFVVCRVCCRVLNWLTTEKFLIIMIRLCLCLRLCAGQKINTAVYGVKVTTTVAQFMASVVCCCSTVLRGIISSEWN